MANNVAKAANTEQAVQQIVEDLKGVAKAWRTVRPKDEQERSDSVIRAWLLMRVVIGVLAVALPVGCVAFEGKIDGQWTARDSISSYYHSGARDYFVSTLVVIGFFLITYKCLEWKGYDGWENALSIVAGVAAICIAFFPTKVEGTSYVHVGAFIAFVLAGASLCLCFGLRAGRKKIETSSTPGAGALEVTAEERTDNQPTADALGLPALPRLWWRSIHWGVAGAIGGAGLFMLLNSLLEWDIKKATFWGEFAALFAFGISWFLKGTELNMLFPGWKPGRIARFIRWVGRLVQGIWPWQ